MKTVYLLYQVDGSGVEFYFAGGRFARGKHKDIIEETTFKKEKAVQYKTLQNARIASKGSNWKIKPYIVE